MEPKKNPDKDVYRMSGMFMGVGLIVSLGLVIAAFNFRSYDEQAEIMTIAPPQSSEEEIVDIPITDIPPPPPPKVQQPEIVEVPDEKEIEELDVELEVEMEEETPVTTEVVSVPIVTSAPVAAPVEEVDEIFTVVEDQPEPQGGMGAFMKYLGENIRYPEQARRMGVEGRVFVQFVVEKDGSLTDIQVARGIGAGCDAEAVRVLKAAPDWKPGKQRGRPVRVKMIIPILFRMG